MRRGGVSGRWRFDPVLRKDLRLVAFYLPQFHPIGENDQWWGPGFTDWRNVVKARSLFRCHAQPHLPADLGFYDLRVPEVREAQAALAREYGVHGFCYYHYWFNGHRLLERPFAEVLASGKPDFPFCLCWANENWTRRWDGKENEVLIAQQYSEEDDRAHIRSLLPAFQDRRYIKVRGRPVFLVWHTRKLPNARRTAEIWNEEAVRAGLAGLYLCNVLGWASERAAGDPALHGFDAAVDFQPDGTLVPAARMRAPLWRRGFGLRRQAQVFAEHTVCDYERLVEGALARPMPAFKMFPGVTPGWDNSARRKSGARILANARPDLYQRWLTRVLQDFDPPAAEENFVFVNAWNEWAEGCHLEPCERWGRAYLEATRTAIEAASRSGEESLPCNPN